MLKLFLALGALLAPTLPPQHDTPASVENPTPLRLAIVGASVSNGFGLSEELEVNCKLTPFVSAALRGQHSEIPNLSDGFMFNDSLGSAQRQLEQALASEPEILLAADFPFWFGYGAPDDLDVRMRRLERGLELLEAVECTVLLGDFPDMSPALNGSSPLTGGKPIIGPHQIPALEQQLELNERLRAWAEQHDNVHVFDMSRFVAELRTPEAFEIRGNTLDAKAKAALLQADLLHPKVRGTALFTILLFDQLVRDGVLAESQVEWKLETLEAAAWTHTEAAREKQRARRERREQRKRELEERKREKEQKRGSALEAA